jgi:hypothetical protein
VLADETVASIQVSNPANGLVTACSRMTSTLAHNPPKSTRS